MTCSAQFTISDGLSIVRIGVGSLSGSYQIAREGLAAGVSVFRSAAGTGALDVLWEKTRWTITGAGPADPELYSLRLAAPSGADLLWTVTIPGFGDDNNEESWTVVPARPTQTRDRISGDHSWTLVLEQAD